MSLVNEADNKNAMVRAVMRWAIVLFYVGAGIAHLIAPDKLVSITPSWVPFPTQVVLATGVFELVSSVALVTKPLRWWAGVAMAFYALCVWPANFKHTMDAIDLPYVSSSWLYHGPRLAFQPVIIWWALYAAQVIDWPFGKRAKPLS